ncbi:MAG: sugar phosphate isomerase/epimerase family protein [Vicinamibacteraceae bacterium]
MDRRGFIQYGVGMLAGISAWPAARALAEAAASGASFKVGVTDWNLDQTLELEAVSLAKRIGFEGVQVSIGRGGKGVVRSLPLADKSLQQQYLDASRKESLPIASLCLDILHRNYLKNDPLGQRWVADSIPIATAMGVRVILLPFFGDGALNTTAEMDNVGDALREVAPDAEQAGVIFGLENTISARDNVRIMERAKSPAVLVYYDVGNSTKSGFNIVDEIRWLGNERICEVHLKDNPHYLGEGTIDFPAVVRALADIGFDQWAQLETDSPSDDVEADMRRNLAFIRKVMEGKG